MGLRALILLAIATFVAAFAPAGAPMHTQRLVPSMAHKKGAGSTKNGRDSNAKRLGLKVGGGSRVVAGNIIFRQRGHRKVAGRNVGMGKDHTYDSSFLALHRARHSLTDSRVRRRPFRAQAFRDEGWHRAVQQGQEDRVRGNGGDRGCAC